MSKIGLVTDNHQAFLRIFFQQSLKLLSAKSRREQFVFATFYFQMLGLDFGALSGTRQRAGHNQVRSRFDPFQKSRDFVHFLFAAFSQRAVVIGFSPIRPVGFAVSEKIKVHC